VINNIKCIKTEQNVSRVK